MKKKILGILICMLLIINPYIIQTAKNESNEQNYPSDLEIQIECGGNAPWTKLFKLEIEPTGEASYYIVYPEDRYNGDWTFITSFDLIESEMDQIWNKIISNGFFDLDETYTFPATDGTFANMTVTANGETHSVETDNIDLFEFDDIIRTINQLTPGKNDLFYNAVYNDPPSKPAKPSGPASGKTGIIYTFESSTTDEEDDDIYFLFDWGDETDSGWLGPYSSQETVLAEHSWDTRTDFNVKVKAKDDPNGDGDLSDGKESPWSDNFPISIPKTNELQNTKIQYLLHKILNNLPLIKNLLNFLKNYNTNSNTIFQIIDYKRSLIYTGSGTSVEIEDCNITVRLKIEIYGEGASRLLASQIQSEIEYIWGTDVNSDDWYIDCKEEDQDCPVQKPGCKVKFNVTVKMRNESDNATDGYHQIKMKNDTVGDEGNYSVVNKPLPTPNGGTGTGTWDNNEPQGTWAHEAGHLMGLGDTYVTYMVNISGNLTRRTRPNGPKYKDHIMANLSGFPFQDNITQVVNNGGIYCPCKCCPEENDTEEPENKIETPQNGDHVSNPIIVTGYADDGPEGSGIAELDYLLEWDGGSFDGTAYPIDPPAQYITYELGPIDLGYFIEVGDWISITTLATDAAGNTGTDTITVTWEEDEEDTTPPITEKTIGEPQWEEGYTIASFTPIWLEATDPEPGSGVHYIHYEIWQEGILMGSEDIPGDYVELTFGLHGVVSGIAELRWYAEDNAGNVEEMHYQEHFILY
jgi:hypothetical protein